MRHKAAAGHIPAKARGSAHSHKANEAYVVASPALRIRRHQLLPPGTYVAPRTPTERKLAEIWSAVLHMDSVGVEDNYIDLGGDSLMALVMFAMMAQVFVVSVPTATIIEAPTIAQLARAVDAARQACQRRMNFPQKCRGKFPQFTDQPGG
jgi:hypothetical protein